MLFIIMTVPQINGLMIWLNFFKEIPPAGLRYQRILLWDSVFADKIG
jgi:hypothetical protein